MTTIILSNFSMTKQGVERISHLKLYRHETVIVFDFEIFAQFEKFCHKIGDLAGTFLKLLFGAYLFRK